MLNVKYLNYYFAKNFLFLSLWKHETGKQENMKHLSKLNPPHIILDQCSTTLAIPRFPTATLPAALHDRSKSAIIF
jgi:hypothetical protein